MTEVIENETIELTADTVVSRTYVNCSDRAYATVDIMNIGDSDVLINYTGDFTDGKYLTLPASTAKNGKMFNCSVNLFFLADGADGKVTVSVD